MFVMMRLDNVFKIQTSFDFPLGDLISLLGVYWVLNRYRKREEGGEGEKKIFQEKPHQRAICKLKISLKNN